MREQLIKYIDKTDIQQMDKIKRLNLINSLQGFKSVNLIASKSLKGETNVAIFNSVTHLSSSPAMIGFIQRPTTVIRHNYTNIKETSYFTINQIQKEFIDKAHYTSAKFPDGLSEFDECGLTEEYLDDFYAPFVKESKLKIAVKYLEEHKIEANDTILVVGSIEGVYLPEDTMLDSGIVDLKKMDAVCISGLNTYYEVNKIGYFEYARPGILPVNHITKK